VAETILPAAALRPAHPYPIGGLTAGARKTGVVYKTLHEPRPIVVALLEILGQPLDSHRQQP
jgi:hypothetical protein